MVANLFIEDDVKHYLVNFVQICEMDFSCIQTWKKKMLETKQLFEKFINNIQIQIEELEKYQAQLNEIKNSFLKNLRIEEFYNLLDQLAKQQQTQEITQDDRPVNTSNNTPQNTTEVTQSNNGGVENQQNQTLREIQNLLKNLLDYDYKLIIERIHLLRNQHSKLHIHLQESESTSVLHEINNVIKKYSDSLNVIYSKFNSPYVIEQLPPSKIVSLEYFNQQTIYQLEYKLFLRLVAEQVQLKFEIEKRTNEKIQLQFQIYNGSRDGLNNDAFWNKIGGKSNLLMIFKAKNNSIFGGYSPCQWSGQGGKCDKNLISFLFSQTKKQIYPLKKEGAESAIICDRRFGPIFGSFYYDLMIKADFQSGSSHLGHSYEDGLYKGRPSTVLFGQQPNIVECEIFEIVF